MFGGYGGRRTELLCGEGHMGRAGRSGAQVAAARGSQRRAGRSGALTAYPPDEHGLPAR